MDITSYFKLTLDDDSVVLESDKAWSTISQIKSVEYFGGKKTVYVCTLSVKRIEMFHDGLETSIDIPEGCEVYQAIRSMTDFMPTGGSTSKTHGRCVGIVKDGKVIEERFLNGVLGEVQGVKL